MTAGRLSQWRTAVQRSALPWPSKLLAWTLSSHMDRDGGSCWPSVPRLAAESSLSVRTVQRHLRVLEYGGWLLVERSKGGRRGTNRYRAVLPNGGNPVTETPLR